MRLTDRGWFVIATATLCAAAFLIGLIGGPH